MLPVLETERLILRVPEEQDFELYRDFYRDREASHFYGGPISSSAAWGRLARDVGHWHLRGYGQWILQKRNCEQLVGSCGFAWPTDWPRPELTWWIAKSQRRLGYAKEASLAAINFAYDTLGWNLVQTHMRDENSAAKSLVLSLGGQVISREEFPDCVWRNVYELPDPMKNLEV
ncbi:GNAT family acetyltransferase [Labrenzia sp. OB1]|nr:GNAT family acetyltransferase [Labrenzia sp. OB1]